MKNLWSEFTAMLEGFALLAWWLLSGVALLVGSALLWDWLV